MSADHEEVLVVGDLHLHRGADPAVARDLARLLRQQERPGRLVLNGDVFDLDRVAGEPGAGVGAELAVARVACILECFPGLVDGLSGWLAGGGRIVWLPGNHDAEVCRPEVRELLREWLGTAGDELCFESEAFRERGLHVEHGHQRDPDNRFHPDTASAVAADRLSALPLGCLVTRLLLGRIPAFENRGDNHQTPGRVLARVLRDHRLGALKMIALYFAAGVKIAVQASRARRRGDTASGSTMASPAAVLRRMYLDRMVLAFLLPLFLVLGLAGVLAPASLPSIDPGAALAAGLPCAGLLLVRPRRRREQFSHRDQLGCRGAARELLEAGASLVIMGHTHGTERLETGRGVYLNPGAFDRVEPGGRPYARVSGRAAGVEFLR